MVQFLKVPVNGNSNTPSVGPNISGPIWTVLTVHRVTRKFFNRKRLVVTSCGVYIYIYIYIYIERERERERENE